MSARDSALAYAAKGWPIFPVSSRKVPMVADWANAATINPQQVHAWWTHTPHALIGTPTGEPVGELADRLDGIAALDIDLKGGKNGLRSLAKLGYVDLPKTPTVLTPTGGLHLHFERPAGGFRCTVGAVGRGIGDGLDWRCDGGYIVLPSPGSGYRWDDTCNYDTCSRLPVPADLLPREVEPKPYTRAGVAGQLQLAVTVNSLNGVARCLTAAKQGERNRLLYWAACRFAEAVAAGLLGQEDAWKILKRAARTTGLFDQEINKTIDSAFNGRGG
jgi:hypothetical protein